MRRPFMASADAAIPGLHQMITEDHMLAHSHVAHEAAPASAAHESPTARMADRHAEVPSARPTRYTLKRRVKNLGKRALRRLFEAGQRCGFDLLPRHFYSQIPDI